jgi:hypothetical protein
MAGDLSTDHAGTPPDPCGDHLALKPPGDPTGNLLPIDLGQHPALTVHPVLLIDGVADDLHQDQFLRPVGIKGGWMGFTFRSDLPITTSAGYGRGEFSFTHDGLRRRAPTERLRADHADTGNSKS